ncbi:MAG: hypothetical protein RMY34_21240 [Aulosira sp. DedQUE10]|nr:hypothetical protein [Aulosira sp. DedQUE10]
MARLNNASKTAAESVAAKIAGGNKTTTSQPNNVVSMPSIATDVKGNVHVNVPGLHTLTPDLIPASLPHFHANHYLIGDPLNPSLQLPQATESYHLLFVISPLSSLSPSSPLSPIPEKTTAL